MSNKTQLQQNNADLTTIDSIIDSLPKVLEKEQKTVIPSTVDQEIVPTDSTKTLSKVTVKGDADLKPENIRKNVNIFGKVGTIPNVTVDGEEPTSDLSIRETRVCETGIFFVDYAYHLFEYNDELHYLTSEGHYKLDLKTHASTRIGTHCITSFTVASSPIYRPFKHDDKIYIKGNYNSGYVCIYDGSTWEKKTGFTWNGTACAPYMLADYGGSIYQFGTTNSDYTLNVYLVNDTDLTLTYAGLKFPDSFSVTNFTAVEKDGLLYIASGNTIYTFNGSSFTKLGIIPYDSAEHNLPLGSINKIEGKLYYASENDSIGSVLEYVEGEWTYDTNNFLPAAGNQVIAVMNTGEVIVPYQHGSASSYPKKCVISNIKGYIKEYKNETV